MWKLSASGLYSFEACRACFWLEHHHGKPPSIPFVLNMAMDSVFKARFDSFRDKNEMPPEAAPLAKEGVRLFHDRSRLREWRGRGEALQVTNPRAGYSLVGKIDDVLCEADGRLIPLDFKVSGYAPKEEKQKYYVLQLHAYALMFRAQGFAPSERAYLLHYFIRDTKNPSLSVEFTASLDRVELDLGAFERKLEEMAAVLNGSYPGDGAECEACLYHAGRRAKTAACPPLPKPAGGSRS